MSHRKKGNEVRRRREETERRGAISSHRKRLALGIGGILLAFTVLAVLLSLPSGPRTGAALGQPAPDFTVTDVDGRPFHLAGHAGQVVLLDFMGSRCPACVQEMPFLVSTYASFGDRGLVMISIDVGGSLGTEDPTVARSFLSTYGGSWPIALDNSGIGLTYQVSALPTLYLIGKNGTVAFRHAGIITASDLAAQIQSLM